MKTLIYLFTIAFLIFAGCAKDEIFDNNMSTPEMKKAKVPIPMKGDLYAVPTMELGLIQIPGTSGSNEEDWVTRKLKIGGTVTHLGQLDFEESFYLIDDETYEYLGDGVYFQSGTGILVGANGDSLEFDWNVTGSFLGYTGVATYTGGTGKFEGCSGGISVIAGSFDDASINHFTTEGTLEFD